MATIDIIKERDVLKRQFEKGVIPSEKDFANLIDSVLVKRDDRFFGLWQNGAGYKEGDLVLYGTQTDNVGIYILVSAEQAQAAAEAQGRECNDLDEDCSGNRPPGECCRWQLIHVDSDDHDWHIVQDGTQSVMYAEVYGKLGIGTQTPGAFLHLNATTTGGQLLFNPADSNDGPRLQLKSGVQAQDDATTLFVDQKLPVNETDPSVEWLTNVPLGYAFKKLVPAAKEGEATSETLLLLISSDQNQQPRVGIGTQTPQATLDVANGPGGIRLNVDDPASPQLILLRSEGKSTKKVIQTIDNQYANWTTDTLHGFLFSTTAGKSLITFDAQGNVGIGTTTPGSKFEIADEHGTNGRFSFDVESSNPMLTVTNLLEGGEVNLNLSVEFNTAALVTDAQQGFEFRQNDAKMLSLLPDTNANNPTFSAIVEGFAQTNGLYVRPLQGETSEIGSGLDVLQELKPRIRRPAGGDNHPQMGFVFAGRVGRNPKIAKQFPDKTYGIAQHNLIALLVRSVQELSDQVKVLQDELNELKQSK